jgi:hypothetical protein
VSDLPGLDEPESSLWNQYVALERQGLRRPAIQALGAFVAAVSRYAQERKEAWVFSFCQAVLDEEEDPHAAARLPVRTPLVRDLVFPVLLAAYRRRARGAARWLARYHWAQSLCAAEVVAGFDETYRGLLEIAMREDPHDERTRRLLTDDWLRSCEELPGDVLRASLAQAADRPALRDALIRRLHDWFVHLTHHWPDGILRCEGGVDGALGKLDLLRELAEDAGHTDEHRPQIAEWSRRLEAWRDYLARRSEFPGFREYLRAHGWPGT